MSAQCPACGFAGPAGARFCAACGSAIPVGCSSCGAALVPGGRFCAACGSPVETALAPEAGIAEPEAAAPRGAELTERRMVTILFADLVGSTTLGEEADPEELAEVVNGAFSVMTRAVADSGGHIARLMGDGMLAFFGAPVSHEDDPLRAVRAALSIVEGVAEFAATLDPGRRGLSVRVGLDSGMVVVGQVGSDLFTEYTTLGDAANTAARLQGAAAPGTILISEATARLVRGAVDLEPLAPVILKGKAEPVTPFRVRGDPPEVGTTVRGIPGVTTPLVGREAELARLLALYDDAVASGRGQWVTVFGEAGVGKSRLLEAFLHALADREERATILRGRAVAQEADRAYGLVRDVLTRRYGDGSEAAALAGLESDLADQPRGKTTAADLARLMAEGSLGRGDPREVSERVMSAAGALASALARDQPLVLVLEDLHWADDPSLDVVARFAAAVYDRPAFLLGNARPALRSRRPHWGEGEMQHVELPLAPLTPAATSRLTAALVGHGAPVPDEAVAFVVERSEGNPYFVEELVQMLLASGALAASDGGWSFKPEVVSGEAVPTTLQGVLQARLDTLAAEEKATLQRAAVIGRVFWEAALVALGAPEAGHVDRLRGRGLVLARERSAFGQTREFLFRHALLCDAAYATILKKARPALHGAAADWLLAAAGSMYADFAARIGEHTEAAGRSAEAASHYRAAGDAALAAYSNAAATRFFSRALELFPRESAGERFRCLTGRERALDTVADREAQAVDLDTMAELAAGLDHTDRSYVHFRRSWLAYRTGDAASAETSARAALEEAGAAKPARADALMNLGNALTLDRDYAGARSAFAEALELFQGVDDERGAAKALLSVASTDEELGDLAAARSGLEEALEVLCRLGHLTGEAVTRTNLAVLLARQGNLAEAAPHFRLALNQYRAAGDRLGEAKGLQNLGMLAAAEGDLPEAKGLLETALESYRRLGDTAGAEAVARDLDELVID